VTTGIAGLIYRDPRRAVDDRLVPALVAEGSAGSGPGRLEGPGSVMLALGEACAEQLADSQVVASLDLSNTDELRAFFGPSSLGHMIRRLYAQNGMEFASRLRGAVSIALWLPDTRCLVLVADRFGLQRLYYSATADGLAFSSRVRGPLALPGTGSDLEPDAIYAYLSFGTVPAPRTPYRSVRRLPPGHVLVWKAGELRVQPYWEMVYDEQHRGQDTAAGEMRRHTEEAVRRALLGAEIKHTGAFLSGGTDSSTVVGMMSRLTGERVQAFSIGFREERYNELEYAEVAARHFGAAHYTRLVSADEAFACVSDLVSAYDEPFGNNSSIPTYLCARMARDAGVRLLLAGDGGDEIFGGNERYRREQILARYGRIPAPVRHVVIEPLLRHLPAGGLSPLGKAQRYVERASLPNPDRFYSSEFFMLRERARFLHPDFLAAVQGDVPLDVARAHYRGSRARSELNRLMSVDLKITLGDNDLFKVTRATELAGIAVRFPLLDVSLVEFTGTLPARDKVRGTEKRHLFKRAFASMLPAEILAKVKHGFGLPVGEWLKTHTGFRELLHDTLLSSRCRERNYFAPGALESLFRLHAEDPTPYYGDVLWTVLMLELWHRRHGDVR
jgi:asparagine synthase (glutamine-hydrolysing)